MAGGPNTDLERARAYADGSLAHYDWLVAQGVEYKNSYIAERCIEPSTDDCLIWSGSEEARRSRTSRSARPVRPGTKWSANSSFLAGRSSKRSICTTVTRRKARTLFHKARKWLKPLDEPPFVALDCRVDYCFYSSFTLGGLDTLPTGQVVDEDRRPIAGLYAAGRTACGLPRWGEGYSSGMSLADATFFGRRAGLHAAGGSPR
jgi:hypothetical protein